MTKAERFAALQAERAAELSARLQGLLSFRGDERALDAGTGTGALAFALAPFVGDVVGIDSDAAMVERAKEAAPDNVELLVADAEHMPFEPFEFDLAATLRTLHHTHRPELVVAELVRVTRPGATILVVDQIAPVDPLAALELNAFERARDATTTRVLADNDLRSLFDANGLVLRRSELVRETRDLDVYLDLAGCDGPERERARSLAPRGYEALLGWYVLTRP